MITLVAAAPIQFMHAWPTGNRGSLLELLIGEVAIANPIRDPQRPGMTLSR
jgi:hypothetical protein